MFELNSGFYITASPERRLYYDIIAAHIVILVISSPNSGDTR